MTYEEAISTYKKLLNNGIVTKKMKDDLNNYTLWLITRMRDNIINRNEQDFLELYIGDLRSSLTDMDIVEEYDKVGRERNNPDLNEERKAQIEGHNKMIILEKKAGVNNNGIILSTVIIEVSLLLGLTTAILILALS